MFSINQLYTQSFPNGLVETESGFIIWSVETGLGRLTLVVTVISVDTYLFLAFSTWHVTLRIQELVFSGCTVPSDSKETEIESSNLEASPSPHKNTRVIIVLYLGMEVHP